MNGWRMNIWAWIKTLSKYLLRLQCSESKSDTLDYNKSQDRNVELHFCTTPPEDRPLWGDGDTCWSKCGTAGLRSAEWNIQAWRENVNTCGNWRACMLDNNYFDFSEMFDGNIKCFYSLRLFISAHGHRCRRNDKMTKQFWRVWGKPRET